MAAEGKKEDGFNEAHAVRDQLVRLPSSPSQKSDADFDDTDDFYGTAATPRPSNLVGFNRAIEYQSSSSARAEMGIPGLGLLGSSERTAPMELAESRSLETENLAANTASSSAFESCHEGNKSRSALLPDSGGVTGLQSNDTDEHESQYKQDDKEDGYDASSHIQGPALADIRTLSSREPSNKNEVSSEPSATEDKDAEWQYDSSDAKSDLSAEVTSSSGSDDSEEDDGDDAYELLRPEEQARILMQEDGGSDDGGNAHKSTVRSRPRTTNELSDEITFRPDIVLTAEMGVLELGAVENVVENYLLIRGTLSGETRVLESGSVLCLEDRTIIGVVAETLGRVESPLYSVAFSNPQEVHDFKIEKGTPIYYVETHSTYVFTEPLKTFKGSDASNIHDEEIGDDELEFSDDDAEAEHKRLVKKKKLERKRMPVNSADPDRRPSINPPQRVSEAVDYPQKPISYDDDDEGDEMYTPLSRPADLLAPQTSPKSFNRLKPARGRPFRERGGRDRGQRAKRDVVRRGQRTRVAGSGSPQYYGPPENQGHLRNHASPTVAPVSNPYQSFNTTSGQYQAHQSDEPTPQGAPSPSGSWSHSLPGTYWHHSTTNFNAPYESQTSPASSLPPGSFVNPAFFGNQQGRFSSAPQPLHYPLFYGQANPLSNFHQQPLPVNPSTHQDRRTSDPYDPTRPWIG